MGVSKKGRRRINGGSVRSIQRRDRACWLCRHRVADGEASRDHMSPRSLGGYNKSANYRLAHRVCNTARGNLPYDLTRQVLAALPEDAKTGRVVDALRIAHGEWHRLYGSKLPPRSWETGVGRDLVRRRKVERRHRRAIPA